jgi:hypothetical protein
MLEYLSLGKFATVSSSGLDTIIPLGSVLHFISPTVVVDTNQLTGPIPSELGLLTGLEELYLCKFATISVRSWTQYHCCDLCLTSYLLSGFVAYNTLTGNVDTLFCNIDAFSELSLSADCAGSPPEVVCSCCDCG